MTLGKFLELWTIWTASSHNPGKVSGSDKSLAQRSWRNRQIGVFFAKVDGKWIFLVLVAPLSVTYDHGVAPEDEFNFCYRNPGTSQKGPYVWVASEAPIRDMIDFVTRELQNNGPSFLAHVLIDVYWGWERFLAQVRNDIRGVRNRIVTN